MKRHWYDYGEWRRFGAGSLPPASSGLSALLAHYRYKGRHRAVT